jgi:hypothetical protein
MLIQVIKFGIRVLLLEHSEFTVTKEVVFEYISNSKTSICKIIDLIKPVHE